LVSKSIGENTAHILKAHPKAMISNPA